MARMLESEEAAKRLGVKTATLYAYVSRGLLQSHPSPTSRRSLFDVDDVERLALRARAGKTVETRLATVTTAVTQLRSDGPAYRGTPAVDLAARATFEEVAERLWGPDAGEGPPRWEPLALGHRPDWEAADMIRWAVVTAGARSALRADLRPASVTCTARALVASMVDVLPSRGTPAPDEQAGPLEGTGTVASRLAARLSPEPTDALARSIDAALVLMADHELATSTLAVRVAASTHAGFCDAILAGLGAIAGPLHSGASQLAYDLLLDARRRGAERALDESLRWHRALPGFGHSVYKGGDPRFGALMTYVEELATAGQLGAVHDVVDLASASGLPAPNVDLALAALAWSAGMPRDAGSTICTIARVAGWTAHYLEELRERPLRFRARAVYASPGRASSLGR